MYHYRMAHSSARTTLVTFRVTHAQKTALEVIARRYSSSSDFARRLIQYYLEGKVTDNALRQIDLTSKKTAA